MWLTKLKIAIAEKNPDALTALLEDIPKLTAPKDIETAIYLLREASEFMHTLKDETELSMHKIKKNLAFLRSTEVPLSGKLDITS